MDSIIKKFKSSNLVVHCATEEQAKEFVKICYENSIEWLGNDNYHDTFWEDNECYRFNGRDLAVGNKELYRSMNYPIITFDEFMEEYNKMKQFTLDDLRTGMLVVLRNGVKGVVIKDMVSSYTTESLIVNGKDQVWETLHTYNKDLTTIDRDDQYLDIMEVWQLPHPYCMQDLEYKREDRKLLWKREEVKELTVEEISKLLGYPVKVVGGN